MKQSNLTKIVGSLALGALALTGCKGGGEEKPADGEQAGEGEGHCGGDHSHEGDAACGAEEGGSCGGGSCGG